MNKEVYGYLLQTHGRKLGYWISSALECIKVILLRIVTTMITAGIAAELAAGHFEATRQLAFTFLIVHTVGAGIGAVGNLIGIRAQNAAYNETRLRIYSALTGKDLSFYRNNHTGYLTASFRQHLDGLMVLGRLLRINVIRTGLSVLVPVIILWVSNWQVGIAALAIVIAQLIYIYWSSAKAHKYREMTHEIYRKITGEVTDEITNIVAFKSSGMEADGYKTIEKLGDQETRAYWLRRRASVLLDLPRDLITGIGITAALLLTLANATNDPSSVGLAVMVIIFAFQIVRSVGEIPDLITELDDLITQIYPTIDYLKDTDTQIKDPENPQSFALSRGAISINDVAFSYPSQTKNKRGVSVFKKLSLSIDSGQHVGIVGLSGAGKSTLANLLMRFDDVDSGSITIDGVDIRNVRQSDLRRKIAYVPQEPLLFHRTIKENIAYFTPNATDAAIKRAAKAAHAHDFITSLPDGYDTIVGERGIKLSGGQKQRIVIARSVLKNAAILIFDEATSALDSESEQIIQNALPEIMGNHTAIVIAHRLSTIAGLDRIIVLSDGNIIEDGTHDQLLQKKGQYHRLWQKQVHESN